MTTTRKSIWWGYVITGVVLLFFLAPAMISAADTLLVLFGIALLVGYGVWSWMLWFFPLVDLIREFYREQ